MAAYPSVQQGAPVNRCQPDTARFMNAIAKFDSPANFTSTVCSHALLCLFMVVGPAINAADSLLPDVAQRERIEKAMPMEATAKPLKPRHLLIFNRNLEYNGHRLAILAASEAFTLMGKKTGAFETTVSEDPAVFDRESLRQFDAVSGIQTTSKTPGLQAANLCACSPR